MSEVSCYAPPAAKHAAAPANRTPAGKAPGERSDVFSALLSLVAETRAAPAGESSVDGSGAHSDETEADAHNPAKDSRDHPVAQPLSWGQPPTLVRRTHPTAAAARATAIPTTHTATPPPHHHPHTATTPPH